MRIVVKSEYRLRCAAVRLGFLLLPGTKLAFSPFDDRKPSSTSVRRRETLSDRNEAVEVYVSSFMGSRTTFTG